MKQTAYSFDKETLKKIGKGFLIAFGGFLAMYLEEQIPSIDFGMYQGLVVAVNAVVINLIREYIKGK